MRPAASAIRVSGYLLYVLQMSLVEMPSFSFNINVYGGDITFLPGVEKWINWFIETRVLRPYVLPERLTVPVKFLYDPTLEVRLCMMASCQPVADNSCAFHKRLHMRHCNSPLLLRTALSSFMRLLVRLDEPC